MNFFEIFNKLEETDPEIYDRMDTRRKTMQQFARTGRVLALTALPLALGSLFKKAYGRDTAGIVAVLQYALTLEYLEAEFYTKGVAMAPIPAGAPTGAITTIRDHENAHVALLKSVITQLGATPVSKPTFDFSAGNGSGNGPFKDVFTNYALFLAVAQTFEDTGVRAYKGQAGELMENNDILTAALQIHSVEARHASHIRSMRRALLSNNTIKPWITGKDTGGIGAAVQASYNGEDLTTQAGINIVNIGNSGVSVSAASEAFDEPLSKADVLAIVDPFIA
ncbi:ferritin-like domain-containing protein [Pseudoflavitalea sp. G-6-1-2]|uniref:ferritin-like domain-containing protein n=1 Tax=Pseudoflavitalea sp. G-6-1-2 TaxID=2728841 RepID=UPI00146AF419|nr:ferritin-like domain-containing protein [Pseudoflavitalea sp. G-6-1-2]NML21858.1 ferritin-like domain-containing protein [Pseudoflavitalea sp. G-6-1-2]